MHTVQQNWEVTPSGAISELTRLIDERFPCHPFRDGINRDNFESVIAEFLALSVSFPFIQAGAIYASYKTVLNTFGDTTRNLEVTSAIGAFLVWDEFGGHLLTLKRGLEGLLKLNDTRRNYHSNLLRSDIRTILGKDVVPHRSDATNKYLNELLDGLSDTRRNRNVAHMVAFECHAACILDALWHVIEAQFSITKDERLPYFYGHVGGDAPAEAVHLKMTQNMVAELVPAKDLVEFVDMCLEAYATSISWSNGVIATGVQTSALPVAVA